MQLSRESKWCDSPQFCINAKGQISDFNLAMDLLLGDYVRGSRGVHVREWSDKTNGIFPGRLLPSPLFTASQQGLHKVKLKTDDVFGTSEAEIATPEFGPAKLTNTGICLIDYSSGLPLGIVVYCRLVKLHGATTYYRELNQLLRHELAWELYAISYDKVLLEMDFYTEVVDRHVSALSGGECKRVADLGAGTGNVAIRLLQHGRRVLALDISWAMLQWLRCKVNGDSASNLSVLEENAEVCNRVDSGSFDGVSILLALYDMEHPEAAFQQALRILRPGGTLIITEPKRCFELQPLLDRVDEILDKKGLRESLSEHKTRVFQINNELDPRKKSGRLFAEDIVELLRRAGFRDVSLTDSHLGNCATIVGRKP